MSGHTEDIIKRKVSLDEKLHFITKPISPVEFLRKIRTTLDEGEILETQEPLRFHIGNILGLLHFVLAIA